jgi:hypothetical protein
VSRYTYDSLGALLSGQRGPIHLRYRLYESDIAGNIFAPNVGWDGGVFNDREARRTIRPWVRDIDGGSASVSMSNFRDHTWEITLTRRELIGRILQNLGRYVRLFVEVFDPVGSEWLEFPFGLYQFDPPSASHERYGSSYALTGRSPEVLISEDSSSYGYSVGAGVNILARVRQILTSRGVPAAAINFPPSTKTLQTAMYFDPFQDASSIIWLRIVNALLNAGGFYAVYTDAEGRWTTKEIEALGRREPDAIYTSEGPHRMVVGTIDEEYDWEAFSNKVTVYSGDPNQGTPVFGVAVNRDPNSPGSVQNYGRVVEKEPVQLQNIVSQAEANRLAAAELRRRTAAFHRSSFSTLPDPRRGPKEAVRADVRRADGKVVFGGMWSVVNFTLPLSSPPGVMGFEVHRSESLVAA